MKLAPLVAIVVLAGSVCSQPLLGSYTVGTGGTFADLGAAITALNTNGVAGPVDFAVLGTQSGPWTLGAVAGQGPTAPIRFDGGTLAVLAGAASPLLTLSGCSNVTFSGFVATPASTATLVSVQGATTDCTFSVCSFLAPSSASGAGKTFDLAGGTGITIQDSEFGGGYEAFYALGPNSGTTIQRCRITGGGFWIARIAGTGFTLRNNFITGTSNYGISCGVSGAAVTAPLVTGENLRIYNNSFYMVQGSGTQYCSLRWYSPATNSEVRNNILVDVYPAGGASNGVVMWCSGALRPAVMDNNIFWAPNGIGLVTAGTTVGLAGWQAQGYDLSSLEADPLFVAPTAAPADLRLTPASLAIGRGAPVPGVTDDFFGAPRTVPIDAGAHEFSSGNLLTLTTSGGGVGDATISVTAIDPAANQGYFFISFAASGVLGSGPFFGLAPDFITFDLIDEPLFAGNLFHFPVGVPGVFPTVPFVIPPGFLSFLQGMSMDGVVVLLTQSYGLVGQSNLVRVVW